MEAASDTLTCDTLFLSAWRMDPDFDYNREGNGSGMSLWEWLEESVGRLLSWIFGMEEVDTATRWVLYAFGVALVGYIGWVVYKKRSGLFRRSGRPAKADAAAEDTIYGIDFPREIERAVAGQDYHRAVRLTYLLALKQLSDAQCIDWQFSKTPTEYVAELKDGCRRPAFRELTRIFLGVRYGNRKADAPLYARVRLLHETLQEGGEEA